MNNCRVCDRVPPLVQPVCDLAPPPPSKNARRRARTRRTAILRSKEYTQQVTQALYGCNFPGCQSDWSVDDPEFATVLDEEMKALHTLFPELLEQMTWTQDAQLAFVPAQVEPPSQDEQQTKTAWDGERLGELDHDIAQFCKELLGAMVLI